MKIEHLRATAGAMIDRLQQDRTDDATAEAKKLIKSLRDVREFSLLGDLATAFSEHAFDPGVLVWQAQGLIETGRAAKARKLLTDLAAKVPGASEEFVEAKGLLGRAWKQTFFEAADKDSPQARDAIDNSLKEYKTAFEARPEGSVWAGLNLLALSAFAKQKGLPGSIDIEPRALALKLLTALDATPPDKRDNWYHGSRAEAYLGLGDLDAVEMHVGAYVRSEATTAFALGGTLRQFTELWQLDQQGERGHGIVQALRAGLCSKNYFRLELSRDEILQSVGAQRPSDAQLQKILGAGGLLKYDWMVKGMMTAQSVGVISSAAEGRIGTGFLVRGGDLIPSLGDELIVMTNEHVVSDPPPKAPSVAFDTATITFEAVDKSVTYNFTKVLWQSDRVELDCSLLRLDRQPVGIKPLVIAQTIPPMPRQESAARPRVYVIGYPGGRDLAFSLQDNDLLDHEGPPDGIPPNPVACRVHYRAPTEPGSSGSPVFEASLWRVIALHHAGDKEMQKLNGKAGTWPANEGIWIQSIVKAACNAQV